MNLGQVEAALRKMCGVLHRHLFSGRCAILGKGLSVALAAPLHPAGQLALVRQSKRSGVSSRPPQALLDLAYSLSRADSVYSGSYPAALK